MQVCLFVTCFNDTLFPRAGQAVVQVLERLGHSVAFDPAQTCCGQMHNNSGYPDHALALARRFVAIFREAETVVIPSTSCTMTVREQYVRLARRAGDAVLLREIEALLPRVFEFSEFLVRRLGITDVGACFPHRVTYHASCNSLRGLALHHEPEAVLRAVRGLDFVPLPDVAQCCGFGGTFAIKNAETSAAIATQKVQAVLSSGAEVVCAGDTSCLMHIGGTLSRLRAAVRTLHVAEILAETGAAA